MANGVGEMYLIFYFWKKKKIVIVKLSSWSLNKIEKVLILNNLLKHFDEHYTSWWLQLVTLVGDTEKPCCWWN